MSSTAGRSLWVERNSRRICLLLTPSHAPSHRRTFVPFRCVWWKCKCEDWSVWVSLFCLPADGGKTLTFFNNDYKGEFQTVTFEGPEIKKLFYGSFHKVRFIPVLVRLTDCQSDWRTWLIYTSACVRLTWVLIAAFTEVCQSTTDTNFVVTKVCWLSAHVRGTVWFSLNKSLNN